VINSKNSKIGENGKIEKIKKKRKASKKIFSKILISLTVVFMLAAATAIYFEQEAHFDRMNEKNNELTEMAEAARLRKQEMDELLEKSGTLEYIEKIAREQLGMIKPGETIFSE